MSARCAAWLPLALALAGCSLPFGESPVAGPRNTCEATSDCAEGAVCLAEAHVCAATDVDLEGLILEVRPNAGAGFGANTSFFFWPGDTLGLQGKSSGGFSSAYNPVLPAPVPVRSAHVLASGATPECKTVAGELTLYPVPPFAGLPVNDAITVKTTLTDSGQSLDADVPPGVYDVHVEPAETPGCATPPPTYFYAQKIEPKKSDYGWSMPPTSTLTGTLLVPNTGDFDGWTLDIVEPTRGARLSKVQTLSQPKINFSIGIDLEFTWPDGVRPLIRLRPPDDLRPTVYWDLLGAVQGDKTSPTTALSLQDLLIHPRKVTAFVVHGMTPVPASVVIQSVTLEGPSGSIASYTLGIAQTGEDGSFTVELPPGEYKIRATPFDSSFPIVDYDLTVKEGDDCLCGPTIEVGDKLLLQGVVQTPPGEPFEGVTVTTAPSPVAQASFWSNSHFLAPVASRPQLTSTEADGRFEFRVDPGTSDILVQPAADTNFPWLVYPRIGVTDNVNVGALQLTTPAFLSGRVTDPSGLPVGSADINAWYPVREADGSMAGTVVWIGTTFTSSDGSYTLVLPSSI